MDDPQGASWTVQVIHTAWTAIITVAGGVVAFFTKRLVDQVDAKADKCDLDDLNTRFERALERQADQHRDNTVRLDKIILELGRRNNGG
jgi:hypothetical protein